MKTNSLNVFNNPAPEGEAASGRSTCPSSAATALARAMWNGTRGHHTFSHRCRSSSRPALRHHTIHSGNDVDPHH